jgi:hypothetical protein
MVGYSRRSHRHSPRYPPVVRAEVAADPPNPGRLRSLQRRSKLGQPYQGFRIATIGGSRLLYPSNGNAVTDCGEG